MKLWITFIAGFMTAAAISSVLVLGFLYQGYFSVLHEQQRFYQYTEPAKEQQKEQYRQMLKTDILPSQLCLTLMLHELWLGKAFYNTQIAANVMVTSLQTIDNIDRTPGMADVKLYCQQYNEPGGKLIKE
ncbi:hypothetical protein [Rheinheimera sp.]|uniref:hypothetical protein n=1 Tax=Rheinheimera sp. TaxID=1869214 RepID=UPI0027BA1155|nr:hypothetical protein [Rheinheimera sp.]